MLLNIGGQQTAATFKFLAGWTCVDILPGADVLCDISTTSLPFKDGLVEAVYCSHVLEHIWSWRHDFVVSEFHRVLRPGGRIRIVVPDMDLAIAQYNDGQMSLEEMLKWAFDPALDSNGVLCYNHVSGFNFNTLYDLLHKHNFKFITHWICGNGGQQFSGCDNPGHRSTSLYLEACK